MRRALLVALYLVAIVAANLVLSWQGPWIAVWNAAAFVGLDLVTRDALHDLWRGHLVRNMAALIAAGSAISYVLARALPTSLPPELVGRVALASAIAFGAAAIADALAYHHLRRREWWERVNGSNLAGAAADSLVFVALWPFGFRLTYAFTLWAAKVAGGLVWSLVFAWRRRRADPRS